jgi:tetratricopeptide (TPR) repeat protein
MGAVRTVAYARSWNRAADTLEARCVQLKEQNPSLTLRHARKILIEEGFSISLKGIYGIWQRYNILKRSIEDPLSPLGQLTREARNALVEAGEILKRGRDEAHQKQAALIVNAMPAYPGKNAQLLNRIDDEYLSPRRQLDKLYPCFMKMPMPEYAEKAHSIRLMLEQQRKKYSAIVAGLNEAVALQWMRTPKEEIKLHKILRGYAGKLRDPVLNFQLSYLPATAYVELGDMKQAHYLMNRSRRLLRALPHASFFESYGDLMTFVGDYRTALVYHGKALARRREKTDRTRLLVKITLNHVIAGEYFDALRVSAMLAIAPDDEYYMDYTAGRGFMCYGLGQFEKALRYVRETLDRAEKEQFRNTLYSAIIVLTATARALEKFREARSTLRKYLKLVQKYRLEREKALLEFFLEDKFPPSQFSSVPVFILANMLIKAHTSLRVKDFRRACAYAQKRGLLGFLHRYVVFAPEIVLNLARKGYKTGLPNTVMNFPVFNKETPVYHVKFLGPMTVFCNNHRLRVNLTPKEESMVIHLALRLGEPGKTIPVKDLCRNFWPRSAKPSSQLSHMLVRLRSELRIPKHLMSISAHIGERILINNGLYIATDHQDLEIALAEARALQRAGEWPYARDKFQRALRILRGEPFSRNYDEWSEDMRAIIRNQVESVIMNFLQDVNKLKKQKMTARILDRLKKVFPGHDWPLAV